MERIYSDTMAWGDGKIHTNTYTKTLLPCPIDISYIVTLFYFRFPKNFVFNGEQHNFWELIYIDKGELLVTLDGQSVCLTSGEVLFIKPGTFHDIRANGKIAPNNTVITFACESPVLSCFENKVFLLADNEKKTLSNLISEASNVFLQIETPPPPKQKHFELMQKKELPFGGLQMIKCYLEQLFISIYRRNHTISNSSRNLSSKQQQLYSQTTQQIIYVLEQNISQKITISDIAKMLNLSISQVKSAFKNELGQGLISYFCEMKINEAKRLISQGDLNFTQIAEMLGFESIQYFSRVFKSKTGMTPTEYSMSIQY